MKEHQAKQKKSPRLLAEYDNKRGQMSLSREGVPATALTQVITYVISDGEGTWSKVPWAMNISG